MPGAVAQSQAGETLPQAHGTARADGASETTPLIGKASAERFLGADSKVSGGDAAEAAALASSTSVASDGNSVPLWVRASGGAALGLLYIGASASMILFNKYLMRADRFPFPTCLTTMHMLGSLALSCTLLVLAPGLFPSASVMFSSKKDETLPYRSGDEGLALAAGSRDGLRLYQVAAVLLPFAPIACCGMVSLVASNWAYRYASVAFLQMIKESHIVFVYSLMVLFGLESLSTKNVVILGFVALSSTMAVFGDVAMSLTGLGLQILAGFSGSMQIVLTNRMMAVGNAKVDPMTMVLCVAPVMLVGLVPANFMFWDPRVPERIAEWHPYLMCSIVMAFGLQVITAAVIRTLSGTGHALCSVLKDLAIVFAASRAMGETLSAMQLCGFLGSLFGIGAYSSLKLLAAQSSGAAAVQPPGSAKAES